ASEAVLVEGMPICDELNVDLMGTSYRALLYHKQRNTLVIYHEGHMGCGPTIASSFAPDARKLVSRVLEKADVLYVDMPMQGMNCDQRFTLAGVEIHRSRHDWFALADLPGQSALAYFTD